MLNPTAATELLTQEMLSRKQRTHGRCPNYFTNSDVRLAVHTIMNNRAAESLRPHYSSLIPAEIYGEAKGKGRSGKGPGKIVDNDLVDLEGFLRELFSPGTTSQSSQITTFSLEETTKSKPGLVNA